MQTFLFESRPDVSAVIDRVSRADGAYLKFLSANDLGLTGAHQAGLYLTKDCWSLFFDRPGQPGENLEREFKLTFDEGYETEARAFWYGSGSRSEYRLTRLGFFKNRSDAFLGSLFGSIIGILLIMIKGREFGSRIPFGPYLAVGSLISLLWGQDILTWYLYAG